MLTGRTDRGAPVRMVFYGGKLHSLTTRAAVWCPAQRVWRSWPWSPTHGAWGEFRHDGSRFQVRQRDEYPDAEPPAVQVEVLRGELDDDGDSARGTIKAKWFFGYFVCEARVPFSARRSP